MIAGNAAVGRCEAFENITHTFTNIRVKNIFVHLTSRYGEMTVPLTIPQLDACVFSLRIICVEASLDIPVPVFVEDPRRAIVA